VEQVELVDLLARGREGDRLADHLLDRQGGATTGVAVELGEDDTVERQGGVEGLGHGHRVLAGHGVDDQERVVGARRLGDAADLVHHLGVDGQAAGGVDDAHVAAEAPGLVDARLGGGHRVAGLAEHRDTHAIAQRAQLLDGGGTLEVGAHQQRVAPLLKEPAGQLGARGGLARALEAGHEDHGRRPRCVGDAHRLAAERFDQRIVDQLDDLLGGVERFVDALAHRPLADAGEHGLDDDEVDVGLEQGEADLAQDLVDIALTQHTLATEAVEDALETIGQGLEHEPLILSAGRRAARGAGRAP
jgi:hypothetical protein